MWLSKFKVTLMPINSLRGHKALRPPPPASLCSLHRCPPEPSPAAPAPRGPRLCRPPPAPGKASRACSYRGDESRAPPASPAAASAHTCSGRSRGEGRGGEKAGRALPRHRRQPSQRPRRGGRGTETERIHSHALTERRRGPFKRKASRAWIGPGLAEGRGAPRELESPALPIRPVHHGSQSHCLPVAARCITEVVVRAALSSAGLAHRLPRSASAARAGEGAAPARPPRPPSPLAPRPAPVRAR